MGWTILLLPVV